MDGRGRAKDNIWIERFWKTIKYEYIYLLPEENGAYLVTLYSEYYERYEKEHGEKAYADVIVVDPPRKGCDETLLQTMIQMRPERIVYVSCDSATLARDLKYLCANGYELKKVRPVDQFGHTVHVETVVLMSRVK